MIQKTKNYDMFKFRSDNRAKIDLLHVKRLKESIASRNLLELKPILVNKAMEVIDGQNRLLAAKDLGVEIYYKVEESLQTADIILMNTSKSWTIFDYLNYFCKNGYIEYQKLQQFMFEHGLSLRISLNLLMGKSHKSYDVFRKGEFKFPEENYGEDLETCWQTIGVLQKLNGYCDFTSTAKFWCALIKLINHPNFVAEKWITNVHKMSERFCIKVTTQDYYLMMQEVFNYRNNVKIEE